MDSTKISNENRYGYIIGQKVKLNSDFCYTRPCPICRNGISITAEQLFCDECETRLNQMLYPERSSNDEGVDK